MTHFIYHHNDLDGEVSREIVRKYIRENSNEAAICREINYGMEFDDSAVDYDRDYIYVVDFCLQPQEKMLELIKKSGQNLVWIDHHKTSVQLLNEHEEVRQSGAHIFIESGRRAACELCWEFFYPETDVPNQVKLISQYDCWNKNGEYNWNKEVVPFKMWAETVDIDKDFLINAANYELDVCYQAGELIQKYLSSVDRLIVQENAYITKLKVPDTEQELSTVVLNSSKKGSSQFEDTYPLSQYNLLLTYRNTKGQYWTLGLYSENPDVDCSEIAQKLGALGPFGPGGGHKGAAGCQVDTKTLIKIINI